MGLNIDTTLFPFMDRSGGAERRHGQGTGPAVYATGGETVDIPADLKMGTVFLFMTDPAVNASPVILLPKYNYTTDKLMWFDLTGAEVANGTNLSGYTYRFEVIGK